MVLAGGVGAARFLRGLVAAVPGTEITVIGNTGDDLEVHGLHVSPDLDTVTYPLAGLADLERGWGLAGESWAVLGGLGRLGADTWFQLGDRDLATHLWRTEQLRRGRPLSAATAALAERLGLPVRLLPMTDQPVTTRVHTVDGRDLHIQEFFVRERCRPAIAHVEYQGIEAAGPGPGVLAALAAAAVVGLAPSNPIMSVGPILALPGVRAAVAAARRTVAISPIIAGKALKGPATAMMAAAGVAPTVVGIAQLYRDCVQALVLDEADAALSGAVASQGVRPVVTDTLMVDLAAATRLARVALEAAA